MKKILHILLLSGIAVSVVSKNPVFTFIENDLMNNANVSLIVKDMTNNANLYEYHPGNSFIPASTMKLVTTATALQLLGGSFRFETLLQYDGTIDYEGILNGNIYIRGGGDPTLGSEKMGDGDFLQQWVKSIKKKGIRKILGSIIADESLYGDEGANPYWTWEDIGNYYAPEIYAISYKDNTFKVEFDSKEVGSIPQIVAVSPQIKDLCIINCLKSTKISFDSAYFYGKPHDNERIARGAIPANRKRFTVKGSIPSPGLLLAKDLKQALKKNGIEVTGEGKDIFLPPQSKRTKIYSHFSPPLRNIVGEINMNSNNHYAETLFQRLSLLESSVANSKNAAKIIKNYWYSRLPSSKQLFLYDGCGLSPLNAVSANFLVDMLVYMYNSDSRADFLNSLPVSGISGTLKSFLKNTPLFGKVRAKSGTISRVKSYAGYIERDDKKWVFAVLVNNANGNSREVTGKIENFLLDITQ
ncbi:MAG: D-alanyl-D-alanine carboxypeptidase/D-alanyl-D-alanine-endopeptidase [Paludibacteraceae bacterium]